MERYRFSQQEQAFYEGLRQPYAVYQFVDRRVVTLALSDGFCELFGYTDRAQACYDMDHDMYRETHPDDVARIADAAVRFATEGGVYDVVYRTRRHGGTDYLLVHAMGRHVPTPEGVRLAHVWYMDEGSYTHGPSPQFSELTNRLGAALHEDSFMKASLYNPMTGLPGMSYFFELAEAGRAAIRAEGGEPVLLFMDLSGMKFFNEKHGFSEGDKLIRDFAKVLADVFGSENCCHVSGDHFTAFTREEDLEKALERLFTETEMLNGGDSLRVRVGVYPARLGDVPVSLACDRAKLACDRIRSSYESGCNYYTEALRDEAERRQYVLSNLDRAIAEKWIQVYYQPIIRAANGDICDVEALARWIDPVKGFLAPAEFIPFLEDAGVIWKLDLFVLEQVLEKIKREQEFGLHIVPHSINLSRADFDACDIVDEIRLRVDEAGVAREKITIEVTESIVSSAFNFMKQQIERFRRLGFPVWMDDFGSGYSSMDVLQSVQFDLIKFDMSFMQKLDEGDNGKIVLSELMKMATALGLDTVCEGVETKSQVRFLREIGCAKLQGYYFCMPIPLSEILRRFDTGDYRFAYENPAEVPYYEAVGRVNLYDFSVVANEELSSLHNFFNTLPMGIIEVRGDTTRFVRSNRSYRQFIRRLIGMDLTYEGSDFAKYDAAFMYNVVKTCCEQGIRSFYDEKLPDGSVVHSFARRISVNPVNGTVAVAVVVLSITDPDNSTTYADIARALATDYYTIYAVDLDTERFIEYSSPVGGQALAMERHGGDFFAASVRDAQTRVYEEDRAFLLANFTKENIIKELDEQGVFTMTYRLVDTGVPMYVNMKITRMAPDSNRIIIGVSVIDSQMKQKEESERIQREEASYARITALSGDYLGLYTVNPETGAYIEYTATDEYRSLGFAKTGEDFFYRGIEDGKKTVCPEDLPAYLEGFSREKVLREIRENGVYRLRYRLMIGGEPKSVLLKIVSVREHDGEKLIAGVRAWRER